VTGIGEMAAMGLDVQKPQNKVFVLYVQKASYSCQFWGSYGFFQIKK